MRKVLITIWLLISMCFAMNTFAQPFVIHDTIPIRHNTSRLRLYRIIDKWFEQEKGQKLIGKNWKELQFKGKGYFPYTNNVQIPDIYLSSHAAEKTKGSIIFSIDVAIEDSVILVTFSNFIHEARFSEYGETSYGRIMDYEKVPSGICMEVEEWCNAVWADMKAWSRYETKLRLDRMIPNTLVRKRAFKVEEEKTIVPPSTVQQEASDYLNLENYLLKDTEGKYADYNKDPEEIAAERAAAAAALAEKEKKNAKSSEEDEWDDEYEMETESIENPTQVQQQQEMTSEKMTEEEDYADEEDIEIGEKIKSEKKAKTPKQKKEKQPKKNNDEEDDDYDDYDDE